MSFLNANLLRNAPVSYRFRFPFILIVQWLSIVLFSLMKRVDSAFTFGESKMRIDSKYVLPVFAIGVALILLLILDAVAVL